MIASQITEALMAGIIIGILIGIVAWIHGVR